MKLNLRTLSMRVVTLALFGLVTLPTVRGDVAPLLINGGFEEGASDPAGWSGGGADAAHHLGVSTAVTHTGKRSVKMAVDAGAMPTYFTYGQYVRVAPGRQYVFTGWVKEDGVQGNAGWFVHVYKGQDLVVNHSLNASAGTQDWQKITETIEVPTGADTIQVGTSLYGTGTAYFDDALLTQVPDLTRAAPPPAQARYHLKWPVSGMTGRISPVVPLGYGVCTTTSTFPAGGDKRYRDGGFGIMRSDFAWQDVERTPGQYDFRGYDAQLAQLEPLGVRPLWILDYTNAHYDDNQPPHTPEGLRAFADFARAAAAHYRNCGVIWEIWNEPNEPNFWQTGPNADQYAALVKAAVPAIRASDPSAVILAGSFSKFDLSYEAAFLKDRPLGGVTALSVHPYRDGPPETVIQDYAKLRALIARYTPAGQRPLPIVCSEWGYTTANGQTSEADQARYLTRAYLTNLLCGVNLTVNYNWQNDGSNPDSEENRYGILREDLTPKPAYLALAALLNTLRGYEFRHRIRDARPTDFKLLFQGPGGLATVTWTSDSTASEEAQTPRVTKIGKNAPSYPALLRLARATTSPDDRPDPDVLPVVPGIVTFLTSTSAPLPPQPASIPPRGDQALVNGGFEAGAVGWVPSSLMPGQRLGITDAVSRTGSRSAFVSAEPDLEPSWFNWGQTVAAAPGEHCVFTLWLKKADVRGFAGCYAIVSGADGQTLHNSTLTSQDGYSDWKKLTTDFTVPVGGTSIRIGTCLYGTGVVYFDDASLVKTGHAPPTQEH